MSTLASDTENLDDRVLIEVEQFDPIARQVFCGYNIDRCQMALANFL
jgi:hypothetical protein